MEPRTFELAVLLDGTVQAGHGVLAAFVPNQGPWPAVVALSCDPRHDPGRPIAELAAPAIGWLLRQIGPHAKTACWTLIDGYGRFTEAVPQWAPGQAVPALQMRRFKDGLSIDAFYAETNGVGEAAIELLSAIIEAPYMHDVSPSAQDFLGMVEAHGNLPSPGMVFRKVDAAAHDGDMRKMAAAVQPDPVLSASIIHSANAARFAQAGKTASVPEAVSRLGSSFVRRVVFVADMVSRYKKGVCPGFDYRGYWLNAIATGAAMRGLLAEYQLPARLADDAFTTGLLSGIGWLVIAETYPGLMVRYLERCHGSDPISKARAQSEVFPCSIRDVSARYLERFEFPPAVSAAIAGNPDVDRSWYDCLARAIRVAQGLSPFDCVAVPTNIPVPDACRTEWLHWQALIG